MSEFDRYAQDYDELLRDPIREGFAGDQLFFAERKWLLIQRYFRSRGRDLRKTRWLDVGCGKGELLRFGRPHCRQAAGCDLSEEMLRACGDLEVTLQTEPGRLPYSDASFDFVTAVCVYHHVEPHDRGALTKELIRVLAPGGILGIIEHNPWNPATRLIVSRTPVDQNAILLSAGETMGWMRSAGLSAVSRRFFLYLPERFYRKAGGVEEALAWLPLGGQYAAFGHRS